MRNQIKRMSDIFLDEELITDCEFVSRIFEAELLEDFHLYSREKIKLSPVF